MKKGKGGDIDWNKVHKDFSLGWMESNLFKMIRQIKEKKFEVLADTMIRPFIQDHSQDDTRYVDLYLLGGMYFYE